SELDRAVKLIGKNATAVQGDVASLADLDRLYATVKQKAGKIDIVFANAGGGALAPLGSITEEQFDKTFNSNVKGLLFTVQKALPLLVDGGAVILNASIVSSKGFPAFSVYSATKAAVRSFARGWTVDLKDRKIRVNVISPGPIDTPILDGLGENTGQTQEIKKGLIAGVPMGRLGTPDEIAKAAVFLASDDSSFITGIELFVDGGTAQV
ncbi:MAG: SDR family oxidoreductase, partial [Terriglobales bacterium]